MSSKATTALTAQQMVDVAERLFVSFAAGDIEAVGALFSDDLQVWHSGDPVALPRQKSLEDMAGYMAMSAERRYDNVRRHVLVDGGVVQQHTAVMNVGGHEVALEICAVLLINNDGLIYRIDEYLDRSGMAG
jgi:ketosteroid isomerase-like protein